MERSSHMSFYFCSSFLSTQRAPCVFLSPHEGLPNTDRAWPPGEVAGRHGGAHAAATRVREASACAWVVLDSLLAHIIILENPLHIYIYETLTGCVRLLSLLCLINGCRSDPTGVNSDANRTRPAPIQHIYIYIYMYICVCVFYLELTGGVRLLSFLCLIDGRRSDPICVN